MGNHAVVGTEYEQYCHILGTRWKSEVEELQSNHFHLAQIPRLCRRLLSTSSAPTLDFFGAYYDKEIHYYVHRGDYINQALFQTVIVDEFIKQLRAPDRLRMRTIYIDSTGIDR